MKKIDPNALYETQEVQELLFESVSIDHLRGFGLCGLAKRYWGQNIIDSINRMLEHKRNRKMNVEDGVDGESVANHKNRARNRITRAAKKKPLAGGREEYEKAVLQKGY